MGFSQQEYWSEFPCPPPRDPLNPGIEPVSPTSPALQADSSLLSHRGSPVGCVIMGKLPKLSHPQNEDNGSTYLTGFWGEHFVS